MRLKTQPLEEKATHYRVVPAAVDAVARTVGLEASLRKERAPLVRPKLLIPLCLFFTASLGLFQVLSFNNLPPAPRRLKPLAVRNYTRVPQAEQYLNAATELISWYVPTQTREEERRWVAENQTALSLMHLALTKASGARWVERHPTELLALIQAQYRVAQTEGKRGETVAALAAWIRLVALTRVVSYGDHELVRVPSLERLEFLLALREGYFTAEEKATLHTALTDYLTQEPDWEILAARAQERALVRVYQTCAEESVDTPLRLNWYNVANGHLLQEKTARFQNQLLRLRFGPERILAAYQTYLSALHQQVTHPEQAGQSVAPSQIALLGLDDLGSELQWLARSRHELVQQRKALQPLLESLKD